MLKKSIKQRVMENSFWNLVASVIGKIGAPIFAVILARFLIPKDYGIYSLVFSVAMIFYVFADLGINQAFVKYISSALIKERKKAYAYYKYLFRIKFLLTLSASLLLFALSYPIAHFFFKNDILFIPLIISSVYIFVLSFDVFYSYTFYIIEKVEYIGVRETIYQGLRIILSLFVFFTFSTAYYISGLFFALILTSISLIIYSLFYSKKLLPIVYKPSAYNIDDGRVKKFIGYLALASVFGVLFSYIDSIMLGFFTSPEYVGYYRAAFSLALGIAGFLSFPITILLPIFSKINKSKKEMLFNKVFYYLSIFIIPSIAGLLVFGRYFIRLLYGYLYLPASLSLSFISFTIFPIVSAGIFMALFSSEEKSKVFAKIISITSLLNIILNLILINVMLKLSPLWATAGAAIATTLSWFFYFFSFVYYSKKEFKFSFSFKLIVKPVIASLIMYTALAFSLIYITDINILSGIVLVTGGMLIYFFALFVIRGFNKQDLKLILQLIRKK